MPTSHSQRYPNLANWIATDYFLPYRILCDSSHSENAVPHLSCFSHLASLYTYPPLASVPSLLLPFSTLRSLLGVMAHVWHPRSS